MNIEETKEAIKVMQDYVNGKTIQYRKEGTDNEWIDMSIGAGNWLVGWYFNENEYRIKPEPVYYPYTSPQLSEAIKTHGREVRSKKDPETILLIVGQSKHSAYIATIGHVGYGVFLNDWVWDDDNSPCGTTEPLPF